MSKWNFADVWETVADELPDAPALVHGEPHPHLARVRPAGPTTSAGGCSGAGVAEQDKVALYLHNCPEYLEASFAAYKVGLVPINTNYRYADDELVYLWENADAVAVVFHGAFVERIEGIRDRVPGVRSWLWVDDGTGHLPAVGRPLRGGRRDDRRRPAGGHRRVRAPWGRGPDDIHMLYTGGTTGMPKGVMWRQDDLFARLNGGGFRRYPPEGGIDDVRAELGGERAGHDPAAGLPAHARHRWVHRHGVPERGRPRRHSDRPPVRPGRTARHHRRRAGQLRWSSSATPSPGRSWPPSTPSRAGGTCRAWWPSSPRG